MGRYARLHDNRVHTHHVEKVPAQGLSNRASCDTADEAEEEAKCRHIGSSSGRLRAAVQRAMAMRERQSTPAGDVKGIGAMRHLCNISCLPPHDIRNTLSAPPPTDYWNTAEEEAKRRNIVGPLPGIESTESMRYSRFFCSAPIADEDQYRSLNKAPVLGNSTTPPSLSQSHQICDTCNALPLPQRSANAPPKKLGIFRKLFRLHKKPPSTSVSAS